jgi:hypothetical protein
MYYTIDKPYIDNIVSCIKHQEKNTVCLNDNIDKIDLDVMKYKIQEAFEHILPEKSHFEK